MNGKLLAQAEIVSLSWSRRVPRDPIEGAELAMDAFDALGQLLVPRELTLMVEWADPVRREEEADPDPWMWTLEEGAPIELEAVQGIATGRVPRLNRAAMTDLIRRALGPGDERGVFGKRLPFATIWSSLEVSSAWVRVPPGAASPGAESITLGTERGPVEVKLRQRDDGLFVSASADEDERSGAERHGRDDAATASDPDGDPDGDVAEGEDDGLVPDPMLVAVRTFRSAGQTSLDIDLFLHWSAWTEPEGAGRAVVDRAVADLVRLGWRTDVVPA